MHLVLITSGYKVGLPPGSHPDITVRCCGAGCTFTGQSTHAAPSLLLADTATTVRSMTPTSASNRTGPGKVVVVTGANRGIGLGLVKRFLEKDNQVIAGVRQVTAAEQLQDLGAKHPGKLQISVLDVSEYNSITSWVTTLKNSGLRHVDVLVNNAGIYNDSATQLSEFTPDLMLQAFKTNAMGPFFVTQQLWLQGMLGGDSPSIVINMSSIVASHQDETLSSKVGSRYAYRPSKAALGGINKSLAMDLGTQGVECVLVHPGYVRTDMNKGEGWIDIEDSANGILSLIDSGQPLNGKFLAYNGDTIPW